MPSDDPAAIAIGRVARERGQWPPADGALAVERSSVDFGGVVIGEPVSVSVADGPPVALPVTGIVRDVGLAPGWMEHVVYGFVSRSTLAGLGLSGRLDELRITVRDRRLDQAGVRRIADRVRQVVEAGGHRVSDVQVPVPGEHIHAAQMDSLLFTQGAFGVLALILSGFLVVNLIGAMLAGQVREIGVMKAIGARPAQLAGMYLVLAAGLGLVAAAVSLPIAAVLGRWYGGFKAELLNFEVTGHAIPAGVILAQAGVALLVPVVAAAFPVFRGCRLSVGAALRDAGLAGPPATRVVMPRVSGIARPIVLSLRNAFRRRLRMALTLLALAMGGAVFLGARNLRRSVAEGVAQAYAPLRYDLLVRLTGPAAVEELEATVGAVPGVASAEAWTGAAASVAHVDGTAGNTFALTAPPAATRLLAVPLAEGRWPGPADGNALVVSRRWLEAEAVPVGSQVSLAVNGRISRWTVIGVGEVGLGSPDVFTTREAIGEATGDRRATSVAVQSAAASPGARLELVQRIRQALERSGRPVAATSLVAEMRRVTEDHLLMVAEFLGVMAWVMVVVGGLGLASTMSLAVLERTREIGVLRAIGARHRSILAIVQVEGLVLGVLSWVVALPLSVPMSVILAKVFGGIMLPVPVHYPPDAGGVIAWLGLVVVISLLASAGPAFRAVRISTAAALAYE